MSDIPEDVMNAASAEARAALGTPAFDDMVEGWREEGFLAVRRSIVRAILQERERAAMAAENLSYVGVANAIRKGMSEADLLERLRLAEGEIADHGGFDNHARTISEAVARIEALEYADRIHASARAGLEARVTDRAVTAMRSVAKFSDLIMTNHFLDRAEAAIRSAKP